MQVGCVDDPGDQGPGLLGVPGPVAAPGSLCPDGSCQDAEGQEKKPQGNGTVGDQVQLFPGRHMAVQKALVLHILPHQEDDAQNKGNAEAPVADDGGGYVEAQPVAAKGRHQLVHVFALHGGIADDQEDHRGRKGAQDVELIAVYEYQAHQAKAPGKAGGKFVLIGQGKAACAYAADDQCRGMKNKACRLQDHGHLCHAFPPGSYKKEIDYHGRHIKQHGDSEQNIFDLKIITGHLIPLSLLTCIFPPLPGDVLRTARLPFGLCHGPSRSPLHP